MLTVDGGYLQRPVNQARKRWWLAYTLVKNPALVLARRRDRTIDYLSVASDLSDVDVPPDHPQHTAKIDTDTPSVTDSKDNEKTSFFPL